MVVKILPNDKGTPSGKLADAEVHFTDGEMTAFGRMFRAEALVNLTEDTEVRHARIEALLNPVLS